MGILAIRHIKRIDPDANFANLACGTFLERNVDRKVAVYLYVQRKISREAETVGNANVVLKNVHVRISEARVHIKDGAEHQAPKRKMDIAPGQQAIRDVG